VLAGGHALLTAALLLGWLWPTPTSALAGVGGLTFSGCLGGDTEMGCSLISPPYLLYGGYADVVSPDGKNVYVTAFPGAREGVIDEYSRNAATGALSFERCIGNAGTAGCTETSPSDALAEPESLAISADGSSVYAAASFSSAVDTFSRGASGTLEYKGCIGATAGCTATAPSNVLDVAHSVAVSADGHSVYVGSEYAVALFSRDSAGVLKYEGCIGEDAGCTPTPPSEAVVGVEALAVSPDGNDVYAANASFGVLDVFSRNTATGLLTYTGCVTNEEGPDCATKIPGHALAGGHSLAVSPDGSSLYVAFTGSTGGGGIAAFSRNTSSGALTYLGCFGEGSDCTPVSPVNALQQDYGVAVSPDGQSVYAASEEPNAVAVFARNTSSGALTYENCIGHDEGCAPTDPLDALNDASAVVVSPGGSSVYASGGATVTEFARATGAPEAPGQPSPGTPSSGAPSSGQPFGLPVLAPSSLGPSPPLPSTQTTRATIDNQQLSLTSPSPLACTAATGRLAVTLDSTAITGSKAAKLRFSSAAFYMDKGIRRTGKKTRGSGTGHKKTGSTVSYTPNATASHLPVTLELSLDGLKPGVHMLTVKISYRENKRTRAHKLTVAITKTLTATFDLC
jgi:DNA-binding beta-propeller fold protein YncE